MLRAKRVDDSAETTAEMRVLVIRPWPRGIEKSGQGGKCRPRSLRRAVVSLVLALNATSLVAAPALAEHEQQYRYTVVGYVKDAAGKPRAGQSMEVIRQMTGRVDPFYSVVRTVGRFWVWFFFRSVDVHHAERVPRRGPVLLCINHPNNLIDSLLVGAVVDRKVHYLATAALFRNPLVGRFLRACGAIPVYRRQDDPDKMDKNAGAFAACIATLAAGGLVGIYPEGTTHAESRVQRIRTGAARIALAYEWQRHQGGAGEPLAAIPVGLTFDARKSFGGRVRVSFGEAILLRPFLDLYGENQVKAVDELTTAIQWGMEKQVVHVDRLDRAALVRDVEGLYRDQLVRELHD